MKYIKNPHWTNLSNQKGLLYFSQILSETLFDYALDSYKPQALNSRLLCIEAIVTLEHIESGLIKKPNIESVLDELLWNINSDYAIKELVGDKYSTIINNIKSCRDNHHKLKKNLWFLYRYLDDKRYLLKLQEILTRIIPENREKEKIQNLTKSYLTELINYGYSSGYLYHISNKFFYDYTTSFSDTTPANFFNIFNFNKKKFSVIYIGSSVFKQFENISGDLKVDMKIVDSYDVTPFNGECKSFLEKKPKDAFFIVFSEIEAIDDNMAILKSRNIISKIANFFSFYHHKEKPYINNDVLVINHTDNISALQDSNTKSIIKKSDTRPQVASDKVKEIFSNLSLEIDAIYKISRAIDLHSIALGTEQIENKLLNLWTAIETLIPKDIASGEDRINQIVNALTPFQTIQYIKRILGQAENDFWHYNKDEAKKTLKAVVLDKPSNRYETVAALIMTSENDANRESAFLTLEDYPLLRFRLFYLNRQLSKGENIKNLLENHKKKVEWQIRRIYRVRNLIAHSGKMPSYTNILVENLHNYFDDMLNYIIDSAISGKRIKTIEDAILNADIDYQIILKNIDSIGESKVSINNFRAVI